MSLLEESHPVSPPSNGPSIPQPPIDSYQLRQPICGTETELLIQTFDDRVLVIVTQNGKVGCLTQASLPPQIPLPAPPRSSSASTNPNDSSQDPSLQILSILPPPPPSLNLTSLVGSPPNSTLHGIYVGQIATLILWALETSGNQRRHVVVGLALSRTSVSRESRRDGDDEDLELDEEERKRFAGVMDLVSQWAGPSE